MRQSLFPLFIVSLTASTFTLAADTPSPYHCKEIDVQFALPTGWQVIDPAGPKPHTTAHFTAKNADAGITDSFWIQMAPALGSKNVDDVVADIFPMDPRPGLKVTHGNEPKKARFANHECYQGQPDATLNGTPCTWTAWIVVTNGNIYIFESITKKTSDPLSTPPLANIIKTLKIGN